MKGVNTHRKREITIHRASYFPYLVHFLLNCQLHEGRHFSLFWSLLFYSLIQNTGLEPDCLDSETQFCPFLAV